jgi:hypothetical protein
MVGGRLLALLTGRPHLVGTAAHWAAVWHRRADWLPGYPGGG